MTCTIISYSCTLDETRTSLLFMYLEFQLTPNRNFDTKMDGYFYLFLQDKQGQEKQQISMIKR